MTILLALLGCAAPADDSGVAKDVVELVTSTVYEARSDGDGYVTVEVEVGEDVGALQIVAKRDRGMLSTDYLYGPGGELVLDWEDWYDSSFSLTECFFPTQYATTLNWPVRAEDGPLEPGTWKATIATLDAVGYYTANQTVEIEILTRPEPNPARGSLRAVIAYAEDVRDEPGVEAAVEDAAAYWIELYASIGVALTVEYSDIAVDEDLPDTYEGLDEIGAFHAEHGTRTILMVIGEQIANDRWLYGEAGGIPGPFTGADHAAVFVSWLANAGPDADFDPEDVLLMGETMAHEVGHYVGLFHPVEFDESYTTGEYWDALDDTEDCSRLSSCESSLGGNLMFPYPLCTGGMSDCDRQDEITDNQGGVVQRYVGVE